MVRSNIPAKTNHNGEPASVQRFVIPSHLRALLRSDNPYRQAIDARSTIVGECFLDADRRSHTFCIRIGLSMCTISGRFVSIH